MILDAAIHVLGAHPCAGVADVATSAGVSTQTVYSHYRSRAELLRAVLDRLTAETIAAIEAADTAGATATDSVLRFFDTSWQMFTRYPLLLNGATEALDARQSHELHQPVRQRMERLVRRGQQSGESGSAMPTPWLIAAAIALGHAAGHEVVAGRMTRDEAHAALHETVARALGTTRCR